MKTIISANEKILKLICSYPSDIDINKSFQSSDYSQVISNLYSKGNHTYCGYKHSIFNYIKCNSERYAVYNTLYNTLVIMSSDEYEIYKRIDLPGGEMSDFFIENGLWIGKNISELQNYLFYANMFSNNLKRPLTVTIAPTMKCNANCEYCFAGGSKSMTMSEETESRIVEFILNQNYSDGVIINWFGGEPLMNVSAIDRISRSLRENNVPYVSYMVTNGSLITDEIISNMFDAWNVRNVQITLDGTEEVYLKRKNYSACSDDLFYKILENIKKIAKKGIYVHIRINIDSDNMENSYELVKQLDYIFANFSNIVLYPAFITGCNCDLPEEVKIRTVTKMMSLLNDCTKLTVASKLFSEPKIHSCMIYDSNSFAVDTDGYIYKCEHLIGNKKMSVSDITNKKFERIPSNISYRNKCLNCVFFPKCMGGCSANIQTNDEPCFIEKYIIIAYLNILLS